MYLRTGFYSLGSNGTYLGQTLAPEEQPGASGYAGVANLRLNKIEQDNGLTGVSTTETYTYDQYNNPTKTYRTFPGGSNTVTFEYSNNVAATNNTYHVGRPTKKKATNTLSGNTFSTEEQYSYSNNLVSETKIKGNGTSWLTTAFTYDANGNVTQKTISSDGVSSRTESYEYVGYGQRFLTKSIDTEGLETTFTYNANTGNLLTTTNPYGLVTTFEYDKWERPVKEIDYLGKETVFGYTPQTGGGMKETTDYATGAKEETIYNAFGWVTKSGSLSLDNQWVHTSFEYDVAGRLTRESEPYTGAASQWNTTGYDAYGRVVSQALFTGRVISTSYSNLTTTVNDGTKTVTTTVDALGNAVSVQDPGGTINYTHYANGAVKTADYDGNVVSTTIDGWGRKISLNDPAAGNYTYSYNNYGELLTETSPKGSTTYAYDAYGKPTSKTMTGDLTDHTLTYVYDNATKLISSITGQDNTNSRAYSYNYTYDTYKRPSTIKENTGLAEFELQYTYDTYGRVHKETQIGKNLGNAVSSTITTRNVYDASGILSEIWNDGTPDKLWELDAINARGQALTINLGNGMAKTKTYDSYGYITKIEDKETGSVPTPEVALHTTYSFNQQRGTLTSRNNVDFNHQENFGYDNLDRLTTIGGAVSKTKTYDTRGRITNNTDLGDYVYETSSKYRLKEITPNASGETYFQAHPTQQITYNAFKKPIDIHETGHGRVSFEYGPMMNRSHAYYGGEDESKLDRRYRKHYSAITGTEIVEDTQTSSTKIITYVGGDAYTAPIAHIKRTVNNAIDEYHYLHRDYLGSILAITDADGDVIEKRQFGAWGSVDKFLDSSGTTFNHQSLLNRGYTGHEHFFEVSLIHMNGRMYDPQVGRFLSPDNHIQEPFNTQNYNRYGYVLNNPLMYTDPTGEMFGGPDRPGGGWFGLLYFGLRSLFGGYNSYGSYGSYQSTAPIPTNTGNGLTTPRTPNPDWNFETPNIVSRYYSSLWNGFKGRLNSTANGISSFFSDPFGTIGKAWDSHWETVSNPISFFNSLDETFAQYNPTHQMIRNATMAFHSDDFASTFGRLNGEALADKTVEGAGLALGGISGRVFSGLGRISTFSSKVLGTAQATGTRGHAFLSRIVAARYALDPRVSRVTLDLGYKRLLGEGAFKWGPRPDVGVLFKSGRVKIFEIGSKTDNLRKLRFRNERFMNRKDVDVTGTVRVYSGARYLNWIWPK
ncbi:RHS repeat-associated core domain-containing protein [Flavivirga rizhaonensis]|uniref:RHS repeat-associated core domain-containing protein n=1 Tax=Flavivirga rizhaonensis TaxID=2559571 RepID=UPI001FE5447F|nr:RHS repeat-associated core domain-containing protein [Flavivirga rizhaonensis]